MQSRSERHLDALFAGQPAGTPEPLQSLVAAKQLELPPEFSWRDYAIFLLTIGAQIEHSLMVQYLYAAYSLGGGQVPEAHRHEVAGWRQIILGIAKEEMGHLVTMQNALKFLGAPLALDRQDYPWDVSLAPYPFVLERLTRATLAKYVIAESPDEWPSGVTLAERKEIEALAFSDGKKVNRVGLLFDALKEIFSDSKRLPDSAFHPESYPLQASWDEFGRGYGEGARGSSVAGTTKTPNVLVIRIASRGDALAALEAVAKQGEAPGDTAAQDDEASHFRRFLTVFRGFPTAGAWEPTVPVPTNPVATASGAGPDQTLIEEKHAALWANLFNIRYRMLLTYLAHGYAEPSASGMQHRQGVVTNRMFSEMYNLRAIAAILTQRPLKAGSDTVAGPPFQMPYTLQLPQSDSEFWRLHLDLLQASRDILLQQSSMEDKNAEYAETLLSLDAAAAREIELYAGVADVRTRARTNTGAHS